MSAVLTAGVSVVRTHTVNTLAFLMSCFVCVYALVSAINKLALCGISMGANADGFLPISSRALLRCNGHGVLGGAHHANDMRRQGAVRSTTFFLERSSAPVPAASVDGGVTGVTEQTCTAKDGSECGAQRGVKDTTRKAERGYGEGVRRKAECRRRAGMRPGRKQSAGVSFGPTAHALCFYPAEVTLHAALCQHITPAYSWDTAQGVQVQR